MALRARRVRIVAAVLLGAGATVGCGGSSVATPPSATAVSAPAGDDEPTMGLVEHHRYHHHGGVTLFIAMSLDTLGVSPEQQATVERIRSDLHTRMEPARVAEQNLVAVLADGVAMANLDAPKVDAAIVQVASTAAAVHDASADALNQLHNVLTPPQRAALVDKVEAHWAVWQKANSQENGAAIPGGGHLAALASDLELTPDQVDKIRAGLGERMKRVPPLDPQEIAAHLRVFGEAFRGEQFDAKAVTTSNGANVHMAGWGAAHLANFVEAVSLVINTDQRARFAQRLREHATHDPSAERNP
jgi:Spy/CpxP family protein refolding chaperone